ncbi:TIGR04540 family protein [Clostridium celatum]|uniref:TIGR04540 family protein n=1 Tax=Clostridium celatum TaxID=36834 RepID=UPI00319E06DF
MEIKTFYKSQVEVANALSEVIDAYLEDKIEENFMINSINKIVSNNEDKVINAEGFTTVVKQKCGKRRLNIISKILK